MPPSIDTSTSPGLGVVESYIANVLSICEVARRRVVAKIGDRHDTYFTVLRRTLGWETARDGKPIGDLADPNLLEVHEDPSPRIAASSLSASLLARVR